MAEYRKRTDGSITYGEAAVRHQFPNRKFTIPLPDSVAEELGYDRVLVTEATSSEMYQITDRDGVELKDGKYYTKWKVTDMTAEQKTALDNDRASDRRMDRDSRLESTDWTQFTDSPLTDSKKEEWKTYRQALRDLPTASGWPHTFTWPIPPSA
tara:strand:- start:727 stop:1188 length:462 start_codon:yes stop_codon:yes gene_type:complete